MVKVNNMNVIAYLLLILSALCTGLVAGLLYGYSCSIVPAFTQLSDAEYLQSFQVINRSIQNPVFFASFLGSLICLGFCTWQWHQTSLPFYVLLAATVLYAIGVVGVTGIGNVPLNESLDALRIDSATPEELRKFRTHFEANWNQFHLVRTVCAAFSFLLTLIALKIT